MYPELFQNKDKSWLYLGDKEDFSALKEAIKRNEYFRFYNEEDAKNYAEGAWKLNYFKQENNEL